MIVSINTDLIFQKRLRFTLSFILQHPFCPDDLSFELNSVASSAKKINYNTNTSIHDIPANKKIFSDKIYLPCDYQLIPYYHHEKKVYGLSFRTQSFLSPAIQENKISFDILETIFFHISRYEEFHFARNKRNQWNMMPESSQILVASKINHIPVVDDLVNLFLRFLSIKPCKIAPRLISTHDIDYPVKFTNLYQSFHFGASILKRNPKNILAYWSDYLNYKLRYKIDPYQNVDSLLSIDTIDKILFIHMGADHKFDPKPYPNRSAQLSTIIDKAIDKGYHIGFHPSYLAAIEDSIFKTEKEKLSFLTKQEIIYNRQHFLHFDFEYSLDILVRNKMQFDSSIAYNEHIGYRAGTAFNYQLFDWKREISSSIIEIPLAWMDSGQWYQNNKNPKSFLQDSKKNISNLLQNGNCCINIHNSSFYNYKKYGVNMDQLVTYLSHINKA